VLHGLAGGCFASLDIILHEFLVEHGGALSTLSNACCTHSGTIRASAPCLRAARVLKPTDMRANAGAAVAARMSHPRCRCVVHRSQSRRCVVAWHVAAC
jgi:hypothetical protein